MIKTTTMKRATARPNRFNSRSPSSLMAGPDGVETLVGRTGVVPSPSNVDWDGTNPFGRSPRREEESQGPDLNRR